MKYFLVSLIFLVQFSDVFSCNIFDSTFSREQLECLNDNIYAQELRRGFIKEIRKQHHCKKCAEDFPESSKYIDVIKNSFIVIGYKKNGYGGLFSYLYFKNYKEIYRFWIYPIDEKVYQIREIKKLEASLDFEKESTFLKTNKSITKSWSNPIMPTELMN